MIENSAPYNHKVDIFVDIFDSRNGKFSIKFKRVLETTQILVNQTAMVKCTTLS